MFINPLILSAMAAVSVPVIIHLLNRRKFERVVWAAMRFLRVSVEQNQRRIQIEDILLLILRCLLIALLVLALARPVLHAVSIGGDTSVCAVVILDNSYSMSQTDGVSSRFISAKKAADDILKNLPTGSSASVILASDIPSLLIPQPTHDLTFASSHIKDAPIFDRASNLYPSIKAAFERLEAENNPRKEIYIITDGQALAWRQMRDIQNLFEQHQKTIRPHLLLVGKPEDRNIGITSLRLDGGLVPINQPLRIEVRAKNYGKAEQKELNVSIAVDTDPPMDQATIDSIPPGAEKGISLFARFKSEGYHTITARIDPDHLPADDVRSIAVRAVKDVKVLLVDGDPGREARESEVFFLKNALRPVPRAQWDDYFVKLTIKVPTDLDSLRLEDFDAVFMANVTDLSPSATTQLVNYVRGGGAAMLFLGDNVNVNYYNNELFGKDQLLPARLGPTRGDAKAEDKFLSFSDKSTQHEITSLWKDPNEGNLSAAKFFKSFTLLPDDRKGASDQVRTVIAFADNTPAMLERNFGQGRLLLFASTAKTSWNDLGVRAGIFVPLMSRTLGYMVSRQDEHLNVPVGGSFIHAAPIELVNKDAMITKRARAWSDTARDLNELSESRRIQLENGIPTLTFGENGEINFAGPYEVNIAGGAAAIRFAAQPNPEESSLESLTDDQVKALSDWAQLIRWTPGTPLADTLQQARIGTEITLYLAAIVLALAAAETLLAHWFSKSK